MAVGLKAKLCVVAMWACVGLLGCFSPVKYATDLEVPRLEASYGDVSLEGEIVDRWWESYGDANLNAYVTAVLEHNPTLHVAYLRLVDSELSYRQSVSGYYPDVSFGAGVGYGGTASSESKSDPSYSLGLTASYEVDLWGKVRAQKRIGELTVQSSRDAAETAAISLVGNVVTQWFTIQYTRDRKALTEELLSISEDYCRLVEEYYRNGQTTGMDVLEQRQQIETLRATLKEQETTIRVGLHALEILSGRQVKPHVEGSLPEQVVMGGTPNIDALLERRPDLRSARRQVESADAQVVVALAKGKKEDDKRQSRRLMPMSSGSLTADSSTVCCTTAGNCLWSPISTNFSIRHLLSFCALKSPIRWGSRICDDSSTMARLKCFIPNNEMLALSDAVVPQNTLVACIIFITALALLSLFDFTLSI